MVSAMISSPIVSWVRALCLMKGTTTFFWYTSNSHTCRPGCARLKKKKKKNIFRGKKQRATASFFNTSLNIYPKDKNIYDVKMYQQLKLMCHKNIASELRSNWL